MVFYQAIFSGFCQDGFFRSQTFTFTTDDFILDMEEVGRKALISIKEQLPDFQFTSLFVDYGEHH